MLKFSKMIFPTLVLVCFFPIRGAALPTDPSPDFVTRPPIDSRSGDDDHSKRDLIDIVQPTQNASTLNQDRASLAYFYKYHHELGLQLGALYDTEARGFQDHLHEMVSLRYLYPDHKLQSWEWNGTFISDGTGTLSYSRRFIGSQDRWRPYSALGIGVHVLGEDALASFVLWRQYQLRGAVGFEWTEWIYGKEYQWRMETALAVSARSQQADVSLGYVWPW